MAVDRHVTDARNPVLGQPMRDLLGTPLLVTKQRLDSGVDRLTMLPNPPGSAAAAIRALLGFARPVRTIRRRAAVTPGLAADRARISTQDAGNRTAGQALLPEGSQGVSFLLGELAVHEGSSIAGVIPSSLPAHLFVLGRRGRCTYFVNPRLLFTRPSGRHFVARLNSGVRRQWRLPRQA